LDSISFSALAIEVTGPIEVPPGRARSLAGQRHTDDDFVFGDEDG